MRGVAESDPTEELSRPWDGVLVPSACRPLVAGSHHCPTITVTDRDRKDLTRLDLC